LSREIGKKREFKVLLKKYRERVKVVCRTEEGVSFVNVVSDSEVLIMFVT